MGRKQKISPTFAAIALVFVISLLAGGCAWGFWGSSDASDSNEDNVDGTAASSIDAADAASKLGSGSGSGVSTTADSSFLFADESELGDSEPFVEPSELALSGFMQITQGTSSAGIDDSHVSSGYVCAIAQSSSRLKFRVALGDSTYNYDLAGDGTPLVAPLNMGNGNYTFTIYQNTSENRYVEIFSTSEDVVLTSEFAPYLIPSVYCSYDAQSSAVALASQLVSGASTQAQALKRIYDYLVDNIRYDAEKAAQLSSETGYVPSPDETLQNLSGVCFDYASLFAAMLRSQGIPCKIVTGYVMPENIYHAWNLVYIDGSWHTTDFYVRPDIWSRMDPTFGASGSLQQADEGLTYTERYIY